MTTNTIIRRDYDDPDQYRMTIGEHLEELRRRLILGLVGFFLVFAICMLFGQDVLAIFCKPLIDVLQKYEINPQIYFTEIASPFMVYIEVSSISAFAIASPWIIYQLWLFIAAGLYESERKVVTKYVPLSITLLVTGMLFVYYLVLPWSLQFFIAFSIHIPLPSSRSSILVPSTQPTFIQSLRGDPEKPHDGEIWMNRIDGRVKIFIGNEVRVLTFGPQNLVAPIITLPDYIDLVFQSLVIFGLSFQLPLVVLALVTVGLVEVQWLKNMRRYVYFVLMVIACIIAPGDVVTAIALTIPLIGLYELGIWLSRPTHATMSPS